MGREEYGDEKESSIKHSGGSVIVWECMAAKGPGSATFIDDVTADKSRWDEFSDVIGPNSPLTFNKIIFTIMSIYLFAPENGGTENGCKFKW